MRVLHIIKSLGRGGAETLLPETLKIHNQAEFQFHYIYFLPWKDQMVGDIQQNGGKITCFPARNNIALILKYWEVIRYVRVNKIQLIHCHLPWAGFLGRLIYLFNRIPVIYTEHNKQERYHWVTRYINRFTFNWQTAAVAVSENVATSIRQNILPKISVKTILNGVNTEWFKRIPEAGESVRKDLGVSAGAIVIGTVAVFRFQKRLIEWLEVFADVARLNENLFGIIVGDGPLKDEVLRHRKALGLDDRVFLPGLKSDVRPWLSAIDIYMMTSVFEGLPIAMLEAMSMECGICTTDAGGIKEVIRNGIDGWMVETDAWQQLAVKLKADATAFRQTYGAAGRKRVEECFSLTTMVTEIENLYRNLCKEK